MAEAKGIINKSTLTAIADAIREQKKNSDTMLPREMAGLIESITGYEVVTGEITLASEQNSISVTHALGRTPVLAVAFAQYVDTSASNYTTVQMVCYNINGINGGTFLYKTSTSNAIWVRNGGQASMSDTQVVFERGTVSNGNPKFGYSPYYKYMYIILG